MNLLREAALLELDAFIGHRLDQPERSARPVKPTMLPPTRRRSKRCLRRRERNGIPAQCLSYGPWEGTGMSAALTAAQRGLLEGRGIAFQSVASALREFGAFWESGEAHRIVYTGRAPAGETGGCNGIERRAARRRLAPHRSRRSPSSS